MDLILLGVIINAILSLCGIFATVLSKTKFQLECCKNMFTCDSEPETEKMIDKV